MICPELQSDGTAGGGRPSAPGGATHPVIAGHALPARPRGS